MTAITDLALSAAVRAAPAILFDLFRTLTGIVLSSVPLPPEPGEMLGFTSVAQASAWRTAWRGVEHDRVLGRIQAPRDVLAVPARQVDPNISAALLDAAVAARQAKFDHALLVIAPEVLAALDALRAAGKRLALVSNADCMEIAAWPRSPLCSRFDAALFSCQVGAAKPDPAIYLAACAALQVAPTACLFVGDGGSDELRGAAAVGLLPVQMTGILERHFAGLAETQGQHARYRIAQISELAAGLG